MPTQRLARLLHKWIYPNPTRERGILRPSLTLRVGIKSTSRQASGWNESDLSFGLGW